MSEYVTIRKQRALSLDDVTELADTDDYQSVDTELNSSSNSMPNDTTTVCEELTDLKMKLDQMKMELDGANIEIESLSLENQELKAELAKAKTTIDAFKKLDYNQSMTPTFLNKNKTKSAKKHAKSTSKSVKICKKRIEFQSNQVEEREAEEANKHRNIETDQVKVNKEKPTQETRAKAIERKPTKCKRQIVILSTESRSLQLAEESLTYGKLCHYLKPNAGAIELFNGIEKKLEHFTMEDYCIVIIGESDFTTTKDYNNLIENIKNELSKVQHTNVILCVPTFKVKRNVYLFNQRIESFNSILYSSNQQYEYAFVLDSNQNLSYSSSMFDIKTGHVNDRGLKTIFNDIAYSIKRIDENYKISDTIQQNYKKGTIPYYFNKMTEETRNSFRRQSE